MGSVPNLERWAGLVSLAAGTVHGILTPDHFAEWWGYGVFFIVAAIAQVLFGIALLANLIDAQAFGPAWPVWKVRFLWAGVTGNLLIIALYVVTRTSGIPFFGPEAGQVEPVEAIDLVSKGLELVLIGLLLVRLRVLGRPRAGPPLAPPAI